MEAGRELDALVAERLGLNVLGEAICCCPEGYWYVDSEIEGYVGSMGHIKPVYFNQCHCERLDEGDKEMAAENPHLIEAIAENRRERHVLGHDAMCLEPVNEYSTSIAAAWELVDKDHPCGWFDKYYIARYGGGYGVFLLGERHYAVAFTSADTAPHAICLAFLKDTDV